MEGKKKSYRDPLAVSSECATAHSEILNRLFNLKLSSSEPSGGSSQVRFLKSLRKWLIHLLQALGKKRERERRGEGELFNMNRVRRSRKQS